MPPELPPQVPRPQTTRGRWLARQRADQARGIFSERVLQFNFARINGADQAQLIRTVTSQGGRFVRCVAMRGTTGTNRVVTGLELAQLAMRIQLNGDNDFIGGNGTNFVRLASLFDDRLTPWMWFLSPPLLRSGDRITITIVNLTSGEVAPQLTPEIALRLIDDDLWQELYTRDWRREA